MDKDKILKPLLEGTVTIRCPCCGTMSNIVLIADRIDSKEEARDDNRSS